MIWLFLEKKILAYLKACNDQVRGSAQFALSRAANLTALLSGGLNGESIDGY